ncbi:hypothetical protein LQK80_02555 [Bacillus thuringiensis]|nr:hypothetical protein [Bacillus thuringiensis]
MASFEKEQLVGGIAFLIKMEINTKQNPRWILDQKEAAIAASELEKNKSWT